MKKTIVIVGAGRGLGNHIAKKFADNGFRIVLMARNEHSLKEYEKEFEEQDVEVYTQVVDAEKPETLTKAFKNVEVKWGIPDVLVYNVGVTALDKKEEVNSELLMRRYQMDVASAYHCVLQINMEEFGKKNGTIIFTGGGLALHPEAEYTPLSMDKAALRALAYLLNKELQKIGVFVGTVTVSGGINPKTHFAPELIAEKYFELYKEKKECEIIYQ